MAIYDIVLLFMLSIISAYSTGSSLLARYHHKNSGVSSPNRAYLCILAVISTANLFATVCMSIGAGLLVKFFFIDKDTRKEDLRDSSLLIYLVLPTLLLDYVI
jgi:hypothetical protein